MNLPLIAALPFLALLGAVVVLATPARLSRGLGVASAVAILAAIFGALLMIPQGALPNVWSIEWIRPLGIHYAVALHGPNVLFVLLTGIIGVIALLTPLPKTATTPTSQKLWTALLLAQLAGLLGAFTVTNFVPWFIFWELALIPGYFLIRLYGATPARHGAALTFVLFTAAGSVFLLAGMLYVFAHVGTFDMLALGRDFAFSFGPDGGGNGGVRTFITNLLEDPMTSTAATLAILGMVIAMAVKAPLIPLHSWQLTVYTAAPWQVTMLLSALLSKMGVYGFILLPMSLAPTAILFLRESLMVAIVVTILFGALAAMREKSLRGRLTYISLNHVAFCFLGLVAVLGTEGDGAAMAHAGVYIMVMAHGVTAAGLFLLAGLLEDRLGVRMINDVRGLGQTAPRYAGLFGLFAFASLGLPFMAGFTAEFMILAGAFSAAPIAVALTTLALLATAWAFLDAIQTMLTGPGEDKKPTEMPDLTFGEIALLIPLVALIFWIGLVPQTFVNLLTL